MFIELVSFLFSIAIYCILEKWKWVVFHGIISVFERMYTYLSTQLNFSSYLKITSGITVIESDGMSVGGDVCFQYSA